MGAVDAGPREAELRQRWDALRRRVAAAAEAAGRDVGELTVIAVTKTWPASDNALLQSLGVRDFGENRAQDLAAKLTEIASPDLRWHFIGQLQRNKAAAVGRACAALHTLDRDELISPLARAAAGAGRVLEVFIQVSLDGDPRRGGVPAAGIEALAARVADSPQLRLRGLMAVPPLGSSPRPAFAQLRRESLRLQRSHPEAAALSAGMSADLEEAVMEGATHLRVGTVLMGSRA